MRRAAMLVILGLASCSGCPGSSKPRSVATLPSQPLHVSLGSDGSLVVALRERVVGLSNGAEVWSAPVESAGFLLRLPEGGVLVPAAGKLVVLDPASGAERGSWALPALPADPEDFDREPLVARAAVLEGDEAIVLLADARFYALKPGCSGDGCLRLAAYLPGEHIDADTRLLADGPERWILVETGIVRLLGPSPLMAAVARVDLQRAAKLGVKLSDVEDALGEAPAVRGVLALEQDRLRFEAPAAELEGLGATPIEREDQPPIRLAEVAVLEGQPGVPRRVRFELEARDLLGGVALLPGRLALVVDDELALLDLERCVAPGTSALPLRKGKSDEGCDECVAPPPGCVLWHRHLRELHLHDPALFPDGTVVANTDDRTVAIREGEQRWKHESGGSASVRDVGEVALVAAVDDSYWSPLSLLQLSVADGSVRATTRTGFGPGFLYSTDDLTLERAGNHAAVGYKEKLALVELTKGTP